VSQPVIQRLNPARPRRDPVTRRTVRVLASVVAVMLPSVFLALAMGLPHPDSPAGAGAVSLASSTRPSASPSPATPAADTTTTAPLEVVVNSMTPATVQSNLRTIIKGVVRNGSGSTVEGLEIRAGLSTARYSSIPELDQALDPDHSIGTRPLTTTRIRPTDPMAPGAEVAWRMVLPPGFLDGWADGVFVLALDARSDEDADVVGSSRLPLSWFDTGGAGAPDHRMSLTWLWPLTAPPGRDAEGTLIDDQLPTELNPGGRLAELSAGASANPGAVTWVIDPALLETAASMSAGFRVVGADGETGPTRAGTSASDWLSRVKSATNNPGVDVWALTYADADVDSLGPAGLGPDAVLANTLAPDATSRVLGRRVESVIGWPAGATLTSETIGLYRSADVEALILDRPGETDDAVDPLASVGVKGSRITGVTGDATLARTLSGWTSVGEIEGIAQRQLFLAQLAIMSQVDRRSTVAVVPDRSWSTSAAVLSDLLREIPEIPWLTTATLSDLMTERSPSLTTRSPSSAAGKRSSRLAARYLKKIRTEQDRVASFSEILAPPGDLAGEFETALLRAESVAWRFQRPNGWKLLDRISAQLAATRDRVRPVSGGQITLASATSRVPVTVVNDLDVPVRVGVKLIGDPAVRLVQPDQVLIDIPPGQKVGAEIAVQLLGAGELPVDLQLTTPAGKPYGEPTKLTLRTTAYGAAATYVVAAAFVALAVAIVISTVRRRRKLAQLPDEPGDRGPTDDLPS